LSDLGPRIERLGTCLDRADTAGAAREAHDLVSVAGNCGAQVLSALARDIERSCKRGAASDADQAFAEMRCVASEAINALTSLREQMGRGMAS
jgi:HPt (histidine-containing phosphotransfer) domain-containing protein